MNIFFMNKLFFFALATLPVLLAIYFLFRRTKPLIVSSLMLWQNQLQASSRGWALKKVPLPLTFFIELLILLCLIIAATAPHLPRRDGSVITLVLDNSYSILANSKQSAKAMALEKITHITQVYQNRNFRVILAGSKPKNLGIMKNRAILNTSLADWQCHAVDADIAGSLILANKLSGGSSPVYVMTDQQPSHPNDLSPQLEWFAFGQTTENVAIVNASRSVVSGKDRILTVIANLTERDRVIDVKIEFPKQSYKSLTEKVTIPAGELKKITLQLPSGAKHVMVSLPKDKLDFDNQVILLPEPRRPLRVSLKINSPKFRKLLNKTLTVQDNAVITDAGTKLVITDRYLAHMTNLPQLIIPTIKEKTSAVAGPYSVNHNHALTVGLNLNNTIWNSNPALQPAGIPLILAGNRPLLTVAESATNQPIITLNFSAKGSTLQDNPNWPIFFWNLIEWVKQMQPGLPRHNYRGGEDVFLTVPRDTISINVKAPDDSTISIPASSRRQLLPANEPGLYTVTAGKRNFKFQINPLCYNESDLSRCRNGHFAGNKDSATIKRDFINISWVWLIAALGLLWLHGWMIRKKRVKG
jgi:Aerotolerance regulator N-terminal